MPLCSHPIPDWGSIVASDPQRVASVRVTAGPLVAALQQAIGSEHIQTGERELRFFSQDVFRSGAFPLAAV